MSSPASELATYLAAQGAGTLGGSSNWRLQANLEPTSPDSVVTVYDTGGAAPFLYDEGGRSPSIQIRTRARGPSDAYAKQEECFAILNAIKNQDIGASHYVGVWMISDIIDIGPDDNDRAIYTANYQVERGTI